VEQDLGREPSYIARVSASEREFWAALWRSPVGVAIHELGIDAVRFGPVLAACMTREPAELALNFVLGAGEAGAVEQGHLADAVTWLESRRLDLCGFDSDHCGVDYRVPLISGLPDAKAAEGLLTAKEAERADGPAKLLRSVSPPQFEPPRRVEVLDWREWDDGFSGPIAEALGLPSVAETFFVGLPESESEAWRCYCAASTAGPLAYAAMHWHAGVATLALGSRPAEDREGTGQAAILHRCILDSAAAGCEIVAIASAGLEPAVVDRESMIRAGFQAALPTSVWTNRIGVPA
jgi:hypothetical protein